MWYHSTLSDDWKNMSLDNNNSSGPHNSLSYYYIALRVTIVVLFLKHLNYANRVSTGIEISTHIVSVNFF